MLAEQENVTDQNDHQAGHPNYKPSCRLINKKNNDIQRQTDRNVTITIVN